MNKKEILFLLFGLFLFTGVIIAANAEISGWQMHDETTAIAISQQKDMSASEQGLRRVLSVRPKYLAAHNDLGVIYGMQGRYPEAKREFERALAIAPDYQKAKSNLALLELKISEKKKQDEANNRAHILFAALILAVVAIVLTRLLKKKPPETTAAIDEK